ncbi:MAG: co-chaperone GroES [Planctomycetes bacterium]|nr:co-chaperone GroES [Planctomycetota bacterium]
MTTKTETKGGKSAKSGALTPLGDHVIVERVQAETKSKGGIVLPDSAKEKPREGLVVAVGEGKLTDDGQRVPVAVKPRDRVIFSSYAGTEVKYEGKEYLIVREDEILAVVNG